MKIHLINGNTEQIEQALIRKKVEMGMVEGKSKNSTIRYQECLKDEIVLVGHFKKPSFFKAEITLDRLRKTPLLMREPGSGTLEVIEHALKPHQIKLSQLTLEMQLGSTESIKSYLLQSPSMAFISKYAILPQLQRGELQMVTVRGLKIERPFYFIHLQGKAEALPTLLMRYASHQFGHYLR
ncbi:MAG: LysR substrate-binding domain-containing protein [Chitinophagaceae bacterium]